MRKYFYVISALCLFLILILEVWQVDINKDFFISIIEGLLSNIAIFYLAIFVIEKLTKIDNEKKLIAVNKKQSKFIFFLCNRIIFKILKYLDRAKEDEILSDEDLDFEFALIRFEETLKNSNLKELFYQKIIEDKNGIKKLKEFVAELQEQMNVLVDNLDKIFPNPDPYITELSGKVSWGLGLLNAVAVFEDAIPKANEMALAQGVKPAPEGMDKLLVKVAFINPEFELNTLGFSLCEISRKAQNSNIFISL